MKKVLKYAGISVLALLLLAFLLPLLFKGKIVALVKSEINKNVNAKVDFKDVSVSFFRHFPRLSVGLEEVSVVNFEPFEGDTLVSASGIDASVNIMSLISGKEMTVYGVYLDAPRIHAIVNKEGKANWDIAKEDTTIATGEPTAFHLNLEKYSVKNGYVVYEDALSGMKASIKGLDHEGKGNFTEELFTLSTKTKAAEASFTYASVPYLVNARTGIDADFEIDNKSSKYSFRNAAMEVNALKLMMDGSLQLVNDSTYNMDLSFNAPGNEFRDILSLVPAVYKTDFDKLKTSGTAALKGFVKGTYSPTQLPSFDVSLDVTNGFFQYPDLPKPVQNINIAARFSNPDGVADHTVIDIKKGHLEMGKDPFDFRLLVKNPETSKYIDGVVKGGLNLAELSQFIKLEEGTKVSGKILADAFAKGALSALDGGKGPFVAGGFLQISDLYYASKAVPQPIKNGNFRIALQNNGGVADATTIDVRSGHLEIGNDPLDFTLQLQRPVSSVDFKGTARGRFTLDNVRQFVELEPGTSVKGVMDAQVSFAGSKAAIDQKQYDKVQTSGVVNLSRLDYRSKEYPGGVQLEKAQLQFSPQQMALSNTSGQFEGSRFTASGVLDNVIGYALKDEALKGTLNLAADRINLNDWMGVDTATASAGTPSDPFPVPANLDLSVNARADEVKYDGVSYNNVRGTLLVKDEAVKLQGVQMDALGGTLALTGSYATKENKKKPDIALAYDVKGVDVQKAFYAFNTVQKLMPLGRFLSGKLTSQFNMVGKLNGDMMPDMSSLTGSGTMLLIEGVLQKFQPLDKLASTLSVDALKDVSVKDVKTYFEFTNGKVLVKPFNLKVKDIDMQVGGTHGLDQNMDYIIGMKVPRRYMGAAGNNLVNGLAASANSKGIPVTLSDVVDLNVKMGGTMSQPTIKTDLKGAAGDVSKELKQQAASFVQQKTDSAKQTVKDSLKVVKNQVLQDVKHSVITSLTGSKDSAGKPASLNETKTRATETLKSTFGNLFKKKSADTTEKH